jgi:hypothetical protein
MRKLLVFGDKTFRVTIPDDAQVTFGPWSPGSKDSSGYDSQKRGTLRIYGKSKTDIIGAFSGVTGFRDDTLDYEEQVVIEQGSAIWNSDKRGYSREVKVTRDEKWEELGSGEN